MFDDKLPKPKAQSSGSMNILNMGEAKLLALRAEIDELLPAVALSDLDLEQELVLQYRTVKAMQATILVDEGVQANQKAQVAGQCASTLAQLTKMQTDFYTAERLKAVETSLIRMLKSWPTDLTLKFFEEYEALDR